MRIVLLSLQLNFRQAISVIDFSHISYFWGKMGAGKSSIARLVDYCLGGNPEPTTALQKEFVSATLHMIVGDATVSIFREAENSKVIVAWEKEDEKFELPLPARDAGGVILPETEVETLSDLLFYLSDITPPRVRRSKRDENSPLIRLSFRDLFWYCYLDQDEMDSDFFHLGTDANPHKRLKSLDALRFILGFHQEQVASLESELVELREKRLATIAGANALKGILRDSGIAETSEMQQILKQVRVELEQVQKAAQEGRHSKDKPIHAADELRKRARFLSGEIQALERALLDLKSQIESTERLRNELMMLTLKFRRSASAREVLASVSFAACPCCTEPLPQRPNSCCSVCGQSEQDRTHETQEESVIAADVNARLKEINESLTRYNQQNLVLRRRLTEFVAEKAAIDERLNLAMKQYDSAFLSQALEYERQATVLQEKIANIERQKTLMEKLNEQYLLAEKLMAEESAIRRKLKDERSKAEKDLSNLRRLEELFLDCLLRAQFPGINPADKVAIVSPNFMPEVTSPEIGDIAVTSFSNLGSGGKKCVFKASFALAIHRLATEIGANLPSLLIIDSPMKNISERENEDVFTSFYEMLYQLAADELSETEFIIVDKEFKEPSAELSLEITVRHMMPDSEKYPPLIPYYRGL
jgi:hypothetical protein